MADKKRASFFKNSFNLISFPMALGSTADIDHGFLEMISQNCCMGNPSGCDAGDHVEFYFFGTNQFLKPFDNIREGFRVGGDELLKPKGIPR